MLKADIVKELVTELNRAQLELSVQINSYIDLKRMLSARLNYLITNHFSRLISLLYRLDISEKKLQQLLSLQADMPAGEIITEMIIERQLQKIEARKMFKNKADNIPEEERW